MYQGLMILVGSIVVAAVRGFPFAPGASPRDLRYAVKNTLNYNSNSYKLLIKSSKL